MKDVLERVVSLDQNSETFLPGLFAASEQSSVNYFKGKNNVK